MLKIVLSEQPVWIKNEYVEKLFFFEELVAEVKAEIDVTTFPAAKGLILSLY